MTDMFHEDQDSIVQTAAILLRTARAALKYADRCFYLDAHSSLPKFMVLQSLFLNNTTMTLSDLAIFTNTERHNITTLVSRLKKEGLINARRSRKDRRSVNVALTDKGISIEKELWPVARKISETLMCSMTEEDLNKTLKNLTTVYQNALEALGEADSSSEPTE